MLNIKLVQPVVALWRPRLLFLCTTTICVACGKNGQQADPYFNAAVANPAYVREHPRVLFDEAHNNVHKTTGLYKPFVDLITNDGYRVAANKEKFSSPTLSAYDILVIANALGTNDSNDSSAFTPQECDAVHDWVHAGGALLLITDHFPTGAAAALLAKRFGVEMSQGMAFDSLHCDRNSGDDTQLEFTRANGLLATHAITAGRNEAERINRLVTFTGQSLQAPDGVAAIMKLSDAAVDRPAVVRVEKSGGDTRVIINYGTPVSAAGRAQAVAPEYGHGRVVVLGEAAMLTAQLDGSTKKPFGMNVAGIDNRQFALNIMHWLSRLLN
jgi:hypothetical protein